MSQTLPHHYYHQAEIFAQERERIFRRHWWLIGPLSEFSQTGDYLALNLMQWPLLILRDQHEVLRGFYNICRHRAGPLALDGSGRCRDLVCRYHGWRYACSGELLKTPGIENEILPDPSTMGLLPIRVESWNELVFACLDAAAPSLTDWLGDIVPIAANFPATASMQFDGKVNKSANCNWKTYGDNSCEGYHVGMVHRDLGASMDRETVKIATYENGEFIGFDVSYNAGQDRSRAGRGFWIYKFPGLLLHFADYSFNAEIVLPIDVDHIELRRWFWSDADQAAARRIDSSRILPNSEQVMDEDVAICELVQRNLAAEVYPGGVLSGDQELGTVYFQQLVRAALNAR